MTCDLYTAVLKGCLHVKLNSFAKKNLLVYFTCNYVWNKMFWLVKLFITV